ncbi:MAG: helix-turn-helix domain-containing protein [Chloroflexota bacterium]|nr:helix-turn-helix domain-containing protein [Chloroflexota bacterium]
MTVIAAYETWVEEVVALPPRSALHSLEPVGVGTPLVESLSSYLHRLAEVHSVPVSVLLRELIAPGLGRAYLDRGPGGVAMFWGKHSAALNGTGAWARDVVNVLEALVHRTDLRCLTMLPWSAAVSSDSLLRRCKAWCSACFDEQRVHDQVIYEPLVWMLTAVTICPRHFQPLSTTCSHPSCGKVLPPLTRQGRIGSCPHCGGWLGVVAQGEHDQAMVVGAEDLEQQRWLVDAGGEMLAAAPRLHLSAVPSTFEPNMSAYLQHLTNGNVAELARRLGITTDALHTWCRGESLPKLGNLLTACAALQTTPLRMLTEEIDVPAALCSHTSFLVESPAPARKRSRPIDTNELEQQLQQILDTDEHPLPTISEVARRLGRNQNVLYRSCPELCRAITARRRKYREEMKAKSHLSGPRKKAKPVDRSQLQRQLETVLTSDEVPPPTVETVAQRLGYCSGTLYKHFPELCHQIAARPYAYRNSMDKELEPLQKRATRHFDRDVVKQALEDTLASDEYPPPTMTSVAHRIGYPHSQCYRYFAELCHAIAAKYLAYRREMAWKQEEELHEQIRQAVRSLVEQGINPREDRVAQAVGKPHCMRSAKAKAVRKEVLRELGYQPKRRKG